MPNDLFHAHEWNLYREDAWGCYSKREGTEDAIWIKGRVLKCACGTQVMIPHNRLYAPVTVTLERREGSKR
jgi:hypothetical protein